jgi:ribose transport system substrate-binding protein
MKLKKLMAVIPALCLVFSTVACSGKSTAKQTSAAESGNGAADSTLTGILSASSGQTYYMVTFLSGYSFWTECWRGFKDAADLLGVNAKYGGATDYDVNSAVTSLQQIIALKPTAMAVTCMDAAAYKEPINNAIAAGIPVVTFDSDSSNSNRTTFIGTSNYAAGVAAAHYIAGKLSGKGRVACLTRTGQSNINERIRGFTETIANTYPGIKTVQVVDAGNDENEAATNIASLLAKDSNINYIFAGLQQAVLGTETALSESGLKGKIKIVGFDTDKTTLDSIKNGTVEATLSQSPYAEGYWSMIYLYMLVNNQCIKSAGDWYKKGFPSLPQTCDSGCTIVTAQNVDLFYTDKSK